LIFEFPTELIEYNGEERPRWMSQVYTMSMHERAKLRKDLKSWRGKDFTDAEAKDFDLAKLLNAPCMVTIAQNEKNGNTYSNISAIGKAVKGAEIANALKLYHFDIDDPETWKCFTELPEWIQAKINNSITLKNRGVQLSKDGEAFRVGAQEPPAGTVADLDDNEEDLPF